MYRRIGSTGSGLRENPSKHLQSLDGRYTRPLSLAGDVQAMRGFRVSYGRDCLRPGAYAPSPLEERIELLDPQLCRGCGKPRRVISAISSPEQDDIIEKILRHRGEWDPPWKRSKPPRGPPTEEQPLTQEIVPDPWSDEEENQDPPGDGWMD